MGSVRSQAYGSCDVRAFRVPLARAPKPPGPRTSVGFPRDLRVPGPRPDPAPIAPAAEVRPMPEYGYFLATEEFGPAELIEQAVGVPRF